VSVDSTHHTVHEFITRATNPEGSVLEQAEEDNHGEPANPG